MIVVTFDCLRNSRWEKSMKEISVHRGWIRELISRLFIFFLRMQRADGSISILITILGRKNALAIDILPVPAPKSKRM
jgi:hypothetical protein